VIVDYQFGQLKETADWQELAKILGGDHLRIVRSVIRHLMVTGAQSYVLESSYIDRDYSSDYRRFYSQTFKTYDRHCKRVHFFAEDVEAICGNRNWAMKVSALGQTSLQSYRGFCVVRPLPGAPIGRTVLHGAGPMEAGLESVVTTRAKYRAHLMGAELDVVGAAFMQQDARVGACAQVAIWAGARHMHQRHDYGWFSVADITKLASPNTSEEAASLPAGSDFLTSERMIRAISEMGFQPLCLDSHPNIGEAILPYVESGLPVILGLQHGGGLGHAVTVIGCVFATPKIPTAKAIDYVQAFMVHDDQAGPYMLVPTRRQTPTDCGFDPNQLVTHILGATSVQFNVEEHGVFAVVPMPLKVFSTAKEAERTSSRRFEAAMADLTNIKAKLVEKGAQPNERLLSELYEARQRNEIVLRTYLTSASGYRRYIAHGTACDELKDVLLQMHLPHFTWVTEISTIGSYNQVSQGMRRIYGHSILDATSTGKDPQGLLMLHIPGLVSMRDVNAKPGTPKQETGIVINNDALYNCREKRIDH
jgi:hypothetical protein